MNACGCIPLSKAMHWSEPFIFFQVGLLYKTVNDTSWFWLSQYRQAISTYQVLVQVQGKFFHIYC